MTDSALPPPATVAAGATPRRRRLTWSHVLRGSVPYWLVLPVVAAVGTILGYPLYHLIRLSLQRYGLPELISHHGVSVGLHNYGSVLHDPVFWHTLLRTVVFTFACVVLTMAIGTLLALLLVRVSSWVRVLLTLGLVLVWSMPAVVAVQVWNYLTNLQNGVVNYVLGLEGHDWYATPTSQLSMVAALVIWGAIPFVVVTVYAGLAQVPDELLEAAEVDGATPSRIFRDVTLPVLKPIFLILTSLSIIWDFGVFTQPFLLIGQSKLQSSNYLMGVYLFEQGYLKSDFGRGAAISILMLLMVAALSVFYVRKMVRLGDVQ